MNFEININQIEELIRGGNRDEAGLRIKQIKLNTIPRSHINSFANLSRRAGQLNLACQAITPIIRPKFPLAKPATDTEKATYALILLGLGAFPEAVELLEDAKSDSPDIHLAFAFAHISRWDYLAAIPRLRSYLRSEDPTLYQKMIAKVNLAASYVATGNFKNGFPLLQEILEATRENDWHLLNRNALEISAQLAIQQQKWNEAYAFLNQAATEGENRFNLDSFFVTKWKAISQILKEGPSQKTIQQLADVRTLAEKNKHWETIRDCDYYQTITTQDRALALNLYFGTPFASYRKRLIDKGSAWLSIPQEYHWQVTNQPSPRIFHLGQGEEIGGSAKMKTGTALYRALVVITSDFYRPFSVGSLHSLVFPKEHFNPDSSPQRVSFLIQRLRTWMKENDLPLIIASEDDGFKLKATAPITFILEKSPFLKEAKSADEPARYLTLIKKIKTGRPGQALRVTEICEITALSTRSVRYFLKWAIEKNKIQKSGSGHESRYKIC